MLWIAIARPTLSKTDGAKRAFGPNPATLRRHVETLSQRFAPRDVDHPENLAKLADYLAGEFKSFGARVRYQEFTVDHLTYKNVLAEYGSETGEVVVIGAHYDTAGDQPGADDNASGVAGLLELGRLLGQTKLTTNVVLAAYTLEEPPLFGSESMGSAVHAHSLRNDGASVKLMISLEMIGYFTDRPDSQGFPFSLLKLFYPSTGNFIIVVDRVFSDQARRLKARMNGVSELPVYSINAPAWVPGVDFSDHVNFWKLGYPAVMVTDSSFYRNDAYHSRRDTAERLDYSKMAQVIDGVFAYVAR
ncbi:MAG: M28 family peptidase [Deltaproteobacteria bacterium]|nr:M28 family peptidase [Deltaproteobacteria bacterium]